MFKKIRNLLNSIFPDGSEDVDDSDYKSFENSYNEQDLFSIKINWNKEEISPCGRMRINTNTDQCKDIRFLRNYTTIEIFIDGKWVVIQKQGFPMPTIATNGPWIPNLVNWLNSIKEKQEKLINFKKNRMIECWNKKI